MNNVIQLIIHFEHCSMTMDWIYLFICMQNVYNMFCVNWKLWFYFNYENWVLIGIYLYIHGNFHWTIFQLFKFQKNIQYINRYKSIYILSFLNQIWFYWSYISEKSKICLSGYVLRKIKRKNLIKWTVYTLQQKRKSNGISKIGEIWFNKKIALALTDLRYKLQDLKRPSFIVYILFWNFSIYTFFMLERR